VATYERRREEYALKLVAEVLQQELIREIRERLGKTYSPQADTAMPDDLDQGYLYAMVETRPGDAAVVAEEVRAAGVRLSRGEITPQAFEAARRPLLAHIEAARPTNAWWLAALSGSAHDPRRTADMLRQHDLIASITLDEVKAAAARWLSAAPVVAVAAPRATGAAP